jgi:hypothetical protein
MQEVAKPDRAEGGESMNAIRTSTILLGTFLLACLPGIGAARTIQDG